MSRDGALAWLRSLDERFLGTDSEQVPARWSRLPAVQRRLAAVLAGLAGLLTGAELVGVRRPGLTAALLLVGLIVGVATGSALARGTADDVGLLPHGQPDGAVGEVPLPLWAVLAGLVGAGALTLVVALASTPLLLPPLAAALSVQLLLQRRALLAAERDQCVHVVVRGIDLYPREGRTLAAPVPPA